MLKLLHLKLSDSLEALSILVPRIPPLMRLQMNLKSSFLRLFPLVVVLFLEKKELQRETLSQGSGNSSKYVKTLRFET